MDSRVRGNDGGEAGIRRQESDSGGGDSDLHRNGKSWKLGKKNLPFRRTPESLRGFRFTSEWKSGGILRKNAVIPAKAGIYSGRLILDFREFYGKIKFGIFARFFCKKRGECGSLSVKMDSRFRGNDGGEAGIPAAFSFFSKLKTINRVHLEFAVFGEIPEVFPFETGRRANRPAVITQNAFQI